MAKSKGKQVLGLGHYRFLHGQAQRNWLPGLLKQFNRSVWVHSESRTAKSGHWGDLRKSTFYMSQWPKKHFRVAESGFWGDFPQVLGGSLYWKVFSDFRFGDRKCRFRDVAIRAILRKIFGSTLSLFFFCSNGCFVVLFWNLGKYLLNTFKIFIENFACFCWRNRILLLEISYCW